MSRLLVFILTAALCCNIFAQAADDVFIEPRGELTLRDAVSAVMLGNPELKAYGSDVRIARARKVRASLAADPTMELEFDEFGGNKSHSGLDSMESSLKLSQLLEFGGKVSLREKVSGYDTQLAELDYQAKELDVCAELAAAFINLLVIQDKSKLASEQVNICQKMADMIGKRVDAGKTSSLDLSKAKIVLARARLTANELANRREYLKVKIASLWGSDTPQFSRAVGSLKQVASVPDLAELNSLLESSPHIEKLAVDLRKRQTESELAKANSKPDVSISGGVKYFNESDDTAFMFGIGIPLRKSVRNQQIAAEAQYQLDKAGQFQKSSYLMLWNELVRLHNELETSHNKVAVMDKEIVSMAKELFDATVYSFEQGKVDYLYLLDSQRSYFSIQEEYLDALAEYHVVKNELDRISGKLIAGN